MMGVSTAAVSRRAQYEAPIRRPRQLELPPEAATVLSRLTSEGRRRFIQELLEALATAQLGDDLRPVRDVVDAWLRTMVVRQRPGYERAMRRSAKAPTGCGLTVEDVRARLAV